MTALKSVLRVAVLVGLGFFGTLQASEVATSQAVAAPANEQLQPAKPYACCWVYYFGRWECWPC